MGHREENLEPFPAASLGHARGRRIGAPVAWCCVAGLISGLALPLGCSPPAAEQPRPAPPSEEPCTASPFSGPPLDLIIEGATVLTLDATDSVLRPGRVLIRGERVVAVEPVVEGECAPPATRVIDASGKLVMPGLINAHTHVTSTLYRGTADGLPLEQWARRVRPIEDAITTRESAELGARIGIAEMIRSGTTTFNDMSFFAEAVATAAAQAGIRAHVAEPVMALTGGGPAGRNPVQALRHTESLLSTWRGSPLVRIAIGPHYPTTVPAGDLRAAAALSLASSARLHIHVAEEPGLMEGVSHVAYLEGLGFLSERVIAVHCVHLQPSDIETLVRRRVGVAHCPESNMKLGDGIAPLRQLFAAGVPLGLGTDGVGSNNDLDMFEAMDAAGMLQMLDRESTAPPLSPREIVHLATRGGARLLGRAEELGSLEAGKLADLLIIDMDAPHWVPTYDYHSQLVHAARGSDVESVIVGGRVIMEARRLTTIDEPALLAEGRELAERLSPIIRRDAPGAAPPP